jgi:hypothetical protein
MPQVYAAPAEGAPDDHPGAFHRALYVFVAQEGSRLHEAGAVVALRCQLPRSNQFYDSAPSKDARPKPLTHEQLLAVAELDPWRSAEHEQGNAGVSTPGIQLFCEQAMIIDAASPASGVGSSRHSVHEDDVDAHAAGVKSRVDEYWQRVAREGELDVAEAAQLDAALQDQQTPDALAWAVRSPRLSA